MKLLIWTICLLLLAATNAQAESVLRWKDKDGKVHYGDRPSEDASAIEQKKFGATPTSGDDDLPYGSRKAKQDFPVTLYVTSDCGDVCVQARAMLNKRGIPFAEKNLVTKEDIEGFKAKTGGNGIPALTVGKSFLSGFEAGQWNSELDIAGYPKIAPYGKRPQQPAAAKPQATTETEK